MLDLTKPAPAKRTVWWAIALTWLVTTLLVLWGAWELRQQVRAQIIERDGEILMALARLATQDEEGDAIATRPVEVMVAVSKLDGIIAASLHDITGECLGSILPYGQKTRVPAPALNRLLRRMPAAQFEPALPLLELFDVNLAPRIMQDASVIPVVRVFIPLMAPGSTEVDAIASFVFEGSAVAKEFARLDKRLVIQGSLALAAAFAITGVALLWAYQRLAHANALLENRTNDLQRANRELSQSARVAALGAITAHLVHSLKNPVLGLRSFMESRGELEATGEDAWVEALAATRRMQTLIQQVVRVLTDHDSKFDFEVTLREAGSAVIERIKPYAETRGVNMVLEGDPPRPIDNFTASLLSLLLTNLLDNGIQATDSGGTVRLRLDQDDDSICEVSDEGPGLAAHVRARLFHPQQSTKEGGSGLGLAITRQLAMALGGSVELVSSGPQGSLFRVRIPFAGRFQSSSSREAFPVAETA